jgi:predicted enzyme related to lactoylglutathione lyase
MPERSKHDPGTPSYVDLASPDPDASKQFYGSLFGWDFEDQDTGDPNNPYTTITQGGKTVAGLMLLSTEMRMGGMPPVWSTYVTVESIDDSVKKAMNLDGALLRTPMDVMEAGRMAVLSDPLGAVLCIWEPRNSIGAELVHEPVSMTWNELITPDPKKVEAFYKGLFGWTAEVNPMPDTGRDYTVWMREGSEHGVAGAMKPPMEGMPAFWGVYFAVDDTDAIVAKAKELGATVLAEPMDIPDVGRMAALTDPQGASFSVLKNAGPRQ